MNILIIGFGRAGKRHAKLLNSMGIKTGLFDIAGIKYDDVDSIYGSEQRPRIYQSFDNALNDNIWDIAVIATPPNTHLDYIEKCLNVGMWASCEKPLCGFGQIRQAEKLLQHKDIDKIQIQYNYRFNPDTQYLNPRITSCAYQMVASQHRSSMPVWGAILDHLSHATDMIRWVSRQNFRVNNSMQKNVSNESITHTVFGTMDDGTPVYLSDYVNLNNCKASRISRLITPNGFFDATPNPEMFIKMYESFFENYRLGLPQYPGVRDALETQKILQEIFEKCVVLKVGSTAE